MPLQDVVHEQDTQILLNHAQLAMVMWQKLQRKTCPPPQFFKNQLQVCVYENKGILMNFETKPPFRILARSTHLVFWVVKKNFFIDDQTIPDTQKQQWTVYIGMKSIWSQELKGTSL